MLSFNIIFPIITLLSYYFLERIIQLKKQTTVRIKEHILIIRLPKNISHHQTWQVNKNGIVSLQITHNIVSIILIFSKWEIKYLKVLICYIKAACTNHTAWNIQPFDIRNWKTSLSKVWEISNNKFLVFFFFHILGTKCSHMHIAERWGKAP